MTTDELLAYIFQAQTHTLSAQFAPWIASSARFRTFAEQYRDKIRKKVRGIRDAEGLKDLQFELEIAYVLLSERRFIVEYEKGGVGKQRGPDFCVTFKTHIPFNVEVKRIRASEFDRQSEPPEYSRIASTVCQKIGQLPAGMINLLAITSGSSLYQASDVAAALHGLRARAERKDDAFFARRGFLGASDFLKQYQRLSALLFYAHLADGDGRPSALWLNPVARRRLPDDLRNALQRLGELPTQDAA
ncbi:MAG TPA: hypothetical protein VKE41_09775 [Roseiflexaceae bacterium]|nr:hypothetical protein [Roseiflexaceae bacterium]